MDSATIPEEFLRLTKTQAFKIAGIPKATFYRKYLSRDSQSVSVSLDESGNEYIAFDELRRVFGEKVHDGLRKYIEASLGVVVEPIETSINEQESLEASHRLELQNVRLEGEVDKLKAVLLEKERLIREQQDRIERLETRQDRLLEDKQSIKSEPKGLIERIKAVFWDDYLKV
jgi:hypothetical protein